MVLLGFSLVGNPFQQYVQSKEKDNGNKEKPKQKSHFNNTTAHFTHSSSPIHHMLVLNIYA